MFRPRSLELAVLSLLFASGFSVAQSVSKPVPDAAAAARQATALAEAGHCTAALPVLKKSIGQVADQDLKRKVGMDGLRCAMTLDQPDDALDFLQVLVRKFPLDPDVLYAEVHAFSDLSTHASQKLAKTAPASPPAHELLAESYEMQGKWDEAEKQYRAIVAQNPTLPGIHFRLGRLLLSMPNPPASARDDAKSEFERELVIDPSNAGAEYVLGELARQNQSWTDAIAHFSRAAKLDPQFAEAFLGLGISLMSLKQYSDAVAPLETAIKLDPKNPGAHYQLATAYTRTGRKQEGQKEFAIHQKLVEGQPATPEGATVPSSNEQNQR
jgi:tetratricopeptide (TPR) repeat protein